MAKINIGIVGYGNLGKAVEKSVLASKNLKLVAIFSRRSVISPYGSQVESYDSFKNFVNKIDVMLLCGGSKSDLEIQSPEVLEFFDVINTFDTHARIPSQLKKLNSIAVKNKHRAIISCGWDPGLFSVVRGLFNAISGSQPITFWGRGISMGHSDALRRIAGVKDGVQFTLPNNDAVKLAKAGKLLKDMPLHFRDCYVFCDKSKQPSVEKKIRNTPNYFKGQPVKVNFVDGKTLLKLKNKMFHRGEIISTFRTPHSSLCKMNLSVSMQSNPHFTASIICAYVNAIISLKERGQVGAFTNLDIPVSYLYLGKDKEKLIEHLC